MSTTSARHLSWVPVIDTDGTRRTLSLQETLEQANLIADLDTDHPVERSALTRFLASAATLVLREAGTTTLASADEWPTAHVAPALDRIDHVFDLHHPETPFVQEWHATVPEGGKVQDISILRFNAPGGSTRAWHVPGALTASPMSLADITRALITRWFHGYGGNGPSMNGGITLGNGTIGARIGLDNALFWQGKTLAQTLAANTPKSWVTSSELPAWADRTATTASTDYAGLWHATFNCNAILLIWDGDTPVQWRRGRSRHQAPSVPPLLSGGAGVKAREDAKAIYDEIRLADHCRFTRLNSEGKIVPYTGIRPEHGPLRNLYTWHANALADHLRDRATAAVADIDPYDLAWGLAAYAAESGGTSQSPSFRSCDWITLRPTDYALPTDAHRAAQRAFEGVAKRLGALTFALTKAGLDKSDFPQVHQRAQETFWELGDHATHEVMDEVRRAIPAIKALRSKINPAIEQTFDHATAPFCGHPSRAAQIHAARALLTSQLRNITKEETAS